MNIGVFTDVYKPSINGVTSSIEVFRKSLEGRGHTVTIIAPAVTGEPPERNVLRLPAVEQFSPKTFPIGLPVLPTTDKQIEALGLDIVHTQHPFFIGQYGDRIAKKLGIPHIHTYHTHLTEYAHYFPIAAAEPFVRHYLRDLTRTFCNKTDITIAPSKAIEELLRAYGVTCSIVVNPTGVDLGDYHRLTATERSQLFRAYKIPTDQQTILFGGRLALEKNLHFLLRSFVAIAAHHPNVHLIYAGGGPDEEALRQAVVKLNLTGRVTITGYLTHPEIAKFFGACDVFAFPSLTDTQGIVLCEAFAGGTPIVAIDAMGSKDIVRDGMDGFLTANDQTAFAAAITKLLNDQDLHKKFSRAALRRAHEFSLGSTTDRLLEIYALARDSRRQTRKGDQ